MNTLNPVALGILAFSLLIVIVLVINTKSSKSSSENNSIITQENIAISKNINSSELDTILEDKEITLLDIRTKDEFDSGHLKNANNIDFYDPNFANTINQLDKDKKYLVYCRSGNRSGQAVELMKKQGFKNIINLRGGILTVNQKYICTGNC